RLRGFKVAGNRDAISTILSAANSAPMKIPRSCVAPLIVARFSLFNFSAVIISSVRAHFSTQPLPPWRQRPSFQLLPLHDPRERIRSLAICSLEGVAVDIFSVVVALL